MFHFHAKHVKIDYHFIREQILENALDVRHILIGDQLADLLTISLPTDRFLVL